MSENSGPILLVAALLAERDARCRRDNHSGGMPGDVGLFFSWPKSARDAAP